MKKRLLTAIILVMSIVFALGITATAAVEEATEFSMVSSAWAGGDVYVTDYSSVGISFEPGNVPIKALPYGMHNIGIIKSFCIYNDRIYYLTTWDLEDEYHAYIYSCDMNGKNNVCLADNVSSYSRIFIVDNKLYYNAYRDTYQGYYGGIYKINLYDNSWDRLMYDIDCVLDYCDGDYVYFTYFDEYGDGWCYAIDICGVDLIESNGDSDEHDWDMLIRGNTSYFMYDYKVSYSRKNHWKAFPLTRSYEDESGCILMNTSKDNVYYCVLNDYNRCAYVYKVNR